VLNNIQCKEATMNLSERSLKVTMQRVHALKHTLSRKNLEDHLGDAMNTRYCKRVSMELAIWFVVGVGLFSADAYRQIFRWLTPLGTSIPGSSTLTEVRKRVGVSLIEKLYLAAVRLLGSANNKVGFYQGMRLMGIDGFTLNLFDSPENRKEFGRPKNGRCYGPFPQARCVALCELGTHVMWRTTIGKYLQGELTLLTNLLGYLTSEMLLLMDRNLLSFEVVNEITGKDGNFLIRCKSNRVLPVLKRLDDGSYFSRIYATQYDQKNDRNGIDVRVIEYTLDDPDRAGCDELHRLVTSLLDDNEHSADELIMLYHERWEAELAFDELKTHLKERPVLRSQRPDGVVQEIYALLISHFIIRKIAFDASRKAKVKPRRISFAATFKILQSKLAEVTIIGDIKAWYQLLVAESAKELLPLRNGRINPRVKKKTTSAWIKKRDKHRKPKQPKNQFHDSIVILV
jgi:hypothetical protein